MASVVYNEAKTQIASTVYDWTADDIRFRLCMTSSTCGTENSGIVTLSDFTLIDVCDSTGYADLAAAGLQVVKDDPNNRAEMDANDVTFAGLGGDASRAIQGCLVYIFVNGTLAADLAVAYIQFALTVPATSTSIEIPWSPDGIITLGQ